MNWRKIPVIVQLTDAQAAVLSTQDLGSLTGCRVKKKLAVINSFSTDVNEELLKDLLHNKYVKKIWYDSEVRAVLDLASSTVRAPGLWDMDLTGKGVAVAILDTGIYDHPDLSGRVSGFKDFIRELEKAYDDNGHGTHVAGCIGSSGNESGGSYRGPAPEASMIGVKVLNKFGSGSMSTVIEGVQWCIEAKNRLKIKIINLSLGIEAYQSYREDPLCQAVQQAWNSGILVCAAAGNSGPERGTINSPGTAPLIITVGASNDRDIPDPDPVNNSVATFSSRGPTVDGLVKPDVLAPGVEIVSLRSPRSLLDKTNKSSRVNKMYLSLSGTSMATPICAGVAAQLLQADSSSSPDQIKKMLTNNATKIPGVDNNSQGAGIIDALKTVNAPMAVG